jgi:hypothetical protein
MTDTDRDRERIIAELNDPFTPHLLALADWHEEQGDDALARAYRRIVAEGKVPDVLTDGWGWHGNDHPGIRYCVTREVHWLIHRSGERFTSLAAIYHALAVAYASLEVEGKRG